MGYGLDGLGAISGRGKIFSSPQRPNLLWGPPSLLSNDCREATSLGVVFLFISLGGVRLSPLGTSANVVLLYQLRMIDNDDYGAVGGMRIGRGNRSTRRKPAPVLLCPPQIPHDLTSDRTRAAAVGSQRLTAWAMARPLPGGKAAGVWS
jgi:hypothetical protein